eukprot:140202-Prorocentrum_minimum.AAC.1
MEMLQEGQCAADLPPEMCQNLNGKWAKNKYKRLKWEGTFDTIVAQAVPSIPSIPYLGCRVHPCRYGHRRTRKMK